MNRDNWKGTGKRRATRLALLAVSVSLSSGVVSKRQAWAQTGMENLSQESARQDVRPRRLPPVAQPKPAEGFANESSELAEPIVGEPETPRQLDDLPPPAPPESRAIVAAARRHSEWIESQIDSSPDVPDRWLQSITTSSCATRATRLIDDAYREYSVGAWASAEASAWKALQLLATGVDVADRQTAPAGTHVTAATDLRSAHDAILECRDFLTQGAAVDRDLMIGISASHRTPVLAAGIPPTMTPTEAVDRYLDFARVKLAPLASYQVQAAQAMDLIAAIGLGRNEARTLPEETALCLRRAALQGQPTNASLASRLGMQLADMGLDDEARWTLSHALSLSPSRDVAQTLSMVMNRLGDRQSAMRLTASLRRQMPDPETQQSPRERMPTIIELSPQQFASISKPMNANLPPVGTADIKDPAPLVASRLGPIAQDQTAPNLTAPNPTAQAKTLTRSGVQSKPSRFTPATLAGFRTRSRDGVSAGQTVSAGTTRPLSGRPSSESAESTTATSAERPSRLKSLIGKLPKIW